MAADEPLIGRGSVYYRPLDRPNVGDCAVKRRSRQDLLGYLNQTIGWNRDYDDIGAGK
jgi:hypothetical protein